MSGLITNTHLLDVLNHPSDANIGFMLSIYNLGCFTGCVISWLIGDYAGRRNVNFLAMVWVMVRVHGQHITILFLNLCS